MRDKNDLRGLFNDCTSTRERLKVIENREKKAVICHMYSEISIDGHVLVVDTTTYDIKFSSKNTCTQLEL